MIVARSFSPRWIDDHPGNPAQAETPRRRLGNEPVRQGAGTV